MRHLASTARPRALALLAGLAFLLTPAALPAQQMQAQPGLPPPGLFLVMACGGQEGATQEIVGSGLGLDGAESLQFSFPGGQAEIVGSAVAKIDVGKKK